MKKKLILMAGLSALPFVLSACGTADALGVGQKKAPDEFKVVKHAPLEIPYGLTLPVPQPGIQRPQEETPEQKAKSAVFGIEEDQEEAVEPGQYATTRPQPIVEETQQTDEATADLLKQLNASEPVQNIREKLEEEYQELEQTEVPVGKKLLNLANGDKEPISEVVDPVAEYERLKTNQEEGLTVLDGETPSKPQ